MNDVYVEYLVKKNGGGKTMLLKFGIVILVIVISIVAVLGLALFGLAYFGFLAAMASIYGGYILITSQNVEYEYILTNGELDLDQVTARRRRRRLVSVKCKDFDSLGKYSSDKFKATGFKTTFLACDNVQSDTVWYFTFNHAKTGRTLLVMNVTERIISAMRPFIPRPMLTDFNNAVNETKLG